MIGHLSKQHSMYSIFKYKCMSYTIYTIYVVYTIHCMSYTYRAYLKLHYRNSSVQS